MYYLCVHVLDDYNFMDYLQICRVNKWWKMMVLSGAGAKFFFEYILSNVNFQIPWKNKLQV